MVKLNLCIGKKRMNWNYIEVTGFGHRAEEEIIRSFNEANSIRVCFSSSASQKRTVHCVRIDKVFIGFRT